MNATRRWVLGLLAAGSSLGSGLATGRASGATDDGHAAGADVAPSATFVRTIPRKPGDPQAFSASLDTGKLKATSGGWARDITTNQLPIATGIAGAHLFLNPGGIREMHWHASAEWGYVIAGHCQVTIIDPEGQMEVVNMAAGDTWLFPSGHAHAIQALGTEPCHAILAFNDGLYGEHGTFGLTDWMSRFDTATLARAVDVPEAALGSLPPGETYIMQGPVVPLDGAAAAAQAAFAPDRSHRYGLLAATPRDQTAGSALRVAPASAFPVSTCMTGLHLRLEPGAIQGPHWHPDANEWHYVIAGRTRVTLFEREKRMAVAELGPGDCAYIPRSCGHSIESIGAQAAEVIGVHDSGTYSEGSLSRWLAQAPRQLVAANLGWPEQAATVFPHQPTALSRPA